MFLQVVWVIPILITSSLFRLRIPGVRSRAKPAVRSCISSPSLRSGFGSPRPTVRLWHHHVFLLCFAYTRMSRLRRRTPLLGDQKMT
ncbi:hypothetical protein B0H10DRAFT_2032582 [Mycena sp. CBHHK59/15]|nr:hypothetical protein B0H10DRAFT_2032582 [Mycena sp. CBHHK59/15]